MYQVYLRSFADGNGDGIGDIAGIRSRLDYISSLGVDAIWVNPWYLSPLNDGGYDVSDYRQILPSFGTIDDARRFIAEAADHGLRVLVDFVPNHTSSDHVWFRAALEAGPGTPERDRYHFRQGKGLSGELPPNNWRSSFGGPAWSRVPDGEWYLHMFDASQPDLNWENPEVRSEFRDILRFWLDMGAAGFRVDVAHALIKEPGYPDAKDEIDRPGQPPAVSDHPLWDRPGLHELIREWRSVLDDYPDAVMVAEAWLPDWSRLKLFVRPGEYHQTFDFQFLAAPWDADAMRSVIDESLAATGEVGSIPTWVLSNHDVVRHATRYGLPAEVRAAQWLLAGDRNMLDRALGLRRARAAALLMLSLPGSTYLYQGEELGLPEVVDLPKEVLEDPVWERSGRTVKGRDGCRVPLPWTQAGESFGFGADGSWLPQPDDWGEFSVENQTDVEGSTLELYRKALGIRKLMLVDESIEWLDLGSDVVAFRRCGSIACIVNFGDSRLPLPEGRILVSSVEDLDSGLPADSAAWIELP